MAVLPAAASPAEPALPASATVPASATGPAIGGPAAGEGPADPLPNRLRQLHWPTWRGVLWRSFVNFIDDACADQAAALTYYAVLALFPSAIVVVALVNLVSDGATAVSALLGVLTDLGMGTVAANETVTSVLGAVVSQQSSAKVLLGFGLLGALYSASNYIGAFTRASNAIYGVTEGRPYWKLRPLQVALSAVALVLMAIIATGIVISGPLVDAVGNLVGADETARQLWTIGRWPVLVGTLMLLLSLLFWVAPNVRQPRFRWLTLGGAVALLMWGVVSFGFGLYVANFDSYDRTYGSLGAIIVFLVWLFLSNSAVLLGVQINAQVQRGRQLQAGVHDPRAPLPPKAGAV